MSSQWSQAKLAQRARIYVYLKRHAAAFWTIWRRLMRTYGTTSTVHCSMWITVQRATLEALALFEPELETTALM